MKAKKALEFTQNSKAVAQAEGFEPPWVTPDKLSRLARYDRFDTPAYVIKL